MKALKLMPDLIVKNGKPEAVILKIQDFEELLERLEDAEDIRWLKAARRKPLSFRNFDSCLIRS